MYLLLLRDIDKRKQNPTRGHLFVDFVRFCSTIEPSPMKGKGCIPKGWYRVDVTMSPKFKRLMPLLRMVPGFEGIRIHAGLDERNTTGCICVCERWKEDTLTKLLLEAQNRHEEIYIEITDTDDSAALDKLREYKANNPEPADYIY